VHGRTFGPDEHATLIAIGAAAENIIQMADSLNANVRQASHEDAESYFRFEVQNLEFTPEKPHPLYQRYTNRWPYKSTPISSDLLDGLERFSQGSCRVIVVRDPAQIRKIADWVRTASEARFQSQDLHELFASSLRFTAEEASQGDGLDVRTLPLPPGGKVFLRIMKNWSRMRLLNRLSFYKFFAATEAKAISDSATLLIIAGPDGRDNALNAGMLLERTWIHLNSQGITVQPYYVVTDQLQRLKSKVLADRLLKYAKRLDREVGEVLASEQTTVHMLLRIGYPDTNPVRSMRLPLEMLTKYT
jgi:hypothetical protein